MKLTDPREILSYTLDEEATLHLSADRFERIKSYDLHNNTVIHAFIIDKDHKDGLEVHMVDTKGYIRIYNKESKKLITALSARPGQIRRYYTDHRSLLKLPILKQAIRTAEKRNREKNYNNI